MNYEFMTADTPLPPCMPLPWAVLRLPVSSTAKVMYARLLDETLTDGIEDSNGILFIRFPVLKLAAALSRSYQTCKRSLNELEQTSRNDYACPSGRGGNQSHLRFTSKGGTPL